MRGWGTLGMGVGYIGNAPGVHWEWGWGTSRIANTQNIALSAAWGPKACPHRTFIELKYNPLRTALWISGKPGAYRAHCSPVQGDECRGMSWKSPWGRAGTRVGYIGNPSGVHWEPLWGISGMGVGYIGNTPGVHRKRERGTSKTADPAFRPFPASFRLPTLMQGGGHVR